MPDVLIKSPNGAWISLIGPPGRAVQGERGEPGRDGRDAKPIIGPPGPVGPPPSQDLLLDLVRQVVRAHREELRGEPGPKGDRGAPGIGGRDGALGLPGRDAVGERGPKGDPGLSGSVPPGAVTLWREDEPMPPGWEWYPLPDGKLGPYRVLWERLIGGGECLRPIRKR